MCSISANLQLTRRSSAGPPPSEEGASCSVNLTFFVQSHQDPYCGGAANEKSPFLKGGCHGVTEGFCWASPLELQHRHSHLPERSLDSS